MATWTLEQVKTHSAKDDLWIVLHNKVYDITKYLEDHPGGKEILIEVAGTDATDAFEAAGHSDEAREDLDKFYVGDLPPEEQTETVEVYRPTFAQVPQSAAVKVIKISTSSSSSSSSWKSLILSAIRLGLSGLAGAGIATAHQRGITVAQVLQATRSVILSVKIPNGKPLSGGASSFWLGVGTATVTQFMITLGFGFWAASKLDVQQEFTHYLPHRVAKPTGLIHLPKTKIMAKPKPLDPRQWRSFVMTSKQEVAPNVYRIVFALPNPTDVLGLPTGQHIALRATINGHSVSRSYTPISNNTDLGRIELIIKVYPNGAMTKHLEQMKVGDTIEIRGPKGAMQYSRQYARHIGMIAGGTGITPMYQLIRANCEDKADRTKMTLLYANNSEEDILMRAELDAFAKAYPDKFEVHYVLTKPSDKWTGYAGFVNADMIAKHLPKPGPETKVLICGPPPMVNAMKKTLEPMNWTMPGPLAKAGDQVFLF